MLRKTLVGLESHEALEETIRRDTVAVANALHVGDRLVRMWKEPPATKKDPEQSGARNPLDRLETIIRSIEKIDPERALTPIAWINARFGCLPPIKMPELFSGDEDIQQALLKWTCEFGETCTKISGALKDKRISKDELKDIYREFTEDIQAGMGLFVLLKEKAG